MWDREAQTIRGGLSRVAAATCIGSVHRAAVTAGSGPVIGQTVTNDLTGRRDFRVKDQSRAAGHVKVAVGVHASAKIESRAGEITQVAIGKDAELEHRDQRHLDVAEHVDVSATGTGSVHLQGVKNLFRSQAGIWPGADRTPSCQGVAGRIDHCRLDALHVIHVWNHGWSRRVVSQVGNRRWTGSKAYLIELGEVGGELFHTGFSAVVRHVALFIIAAHPRLAAHQHDHTHSDARHQGQQEQSGDQRESSRATCGVTHRLVSRALKPLLVAVAEIQIPRTD